MVRDSGISLKDIKWGVGDTNVAQKSEAALLLNDQFTMEFARIMGRQPSDPAFEIRRAWKGPDSIRTGVSLVNQLFDEVIVTGIRGLSIHESAERCVEAAAYWSGKNDDLKHGADMMRYAIKAIADEVGYEPMDLRDG